MVVYWVLESRFYVAMAEIAELDAMRGPPRAIRVIEEDSDECRPDRALSPAIPVQPGTRSCP